MVGYWNGNTIFTPFKHYRKYENSIHSPPANNLAGITYSPEDISFTVILYVYPRTREYFNN